MLLVAVLFIVASLAALFFALGIFGQQETNAARRLRLMTNGIEEVQAGASLRQEERESFARRLTPTSFVERAERNYMLAGRPDNWSVAKILSMKVLLAGAGLGLGLLVLSGNKSGVGVLMLIAATGLGYFAPDVIINGMARRRQEEIQSTLPDLLDQITISIESGSSFENALSRSGQTGEGPLADEIVRTVQDMALGISRRDAYDQLVARTDVEDLRKFVRAITQGEDFGVPVSDIVREQAQEMRVSRRLRAEAKANQVPVKMLFPLIGTILPVLFMVVLGPAIISAMQQF